MIRIYYSVSRIISWPEKVRMSYLVLNNKEVEWRGETKDSGVFYNLYFNFGGAKLDTYL
jgi:hypothetical protein